MRVICTFKLREKGLSLARSRVNPTACKPGPTGSGAFLLTRLPVAGLSTPRGIRAIVHDVTADPSPAGGAGGENLSVERVTYQLRIHRPCVLTSPVAFFAGS